MRVIVCSFLRTSTVTGAFVSNQPSFLSTHDPFLLSFLVLKDYYAHSVLINVYIRVLTIQNGEVRGSAYVVCQKMLCEVTPRAIISHCLCVSVNHNPNLV